MVVSFFTAAGYATLASLFFLLYLFWVVLNASERDMSIRRFVAKLEWDAVMVLWFLFFFAFYSY